MTLPDSGPAMSLPPIGTWYESRHVLVTGGTGFMGKVLVEKLLRDTSVTRIYLLVRIKRGQDAKQRKEDYINHTVFDALRVTAPDALSRITAVQGDVTLQGLGLSPADRATLVESVTVVFHCAANVRFDQKIKDAVHMNVQGTHQVLDLAAEIGDKLQVFLHVSTSYCHCDEEVLEERAYPAPHQPLKLMAATQWMEDDVLNKITPELIKTLPNTYAYTKCLTEELVGTYSGKFPIVIGRPSIVTASWKEPIPGWVENMNGPTGLLVGAGRGVIRSMHCKGDLLADLMPVDIAINALIVLAVTAAIKRSKEILICNITESGDNPISWHTAIETGRKHLYQNPFSFALWYPDGSIKSSWLFHMFCVIFFHYLPAYVIDGLLVLLRKKPFMVNIQNRIHGGLKVLQYYTTKEWIFENGNLRKLSHDMSLTDRNTFYTDIKEVDWDEYFHNYVLGTRKYCLKEDPKTLPKARVLLQRLYYLDMLKNFLLMSFVIWILWSYCSVMANALHCGFDYVTGVFKMAPIARVMAEEL